MSIKNIIFDGFQIIIAALITLGVSAVLIFIYRSEDSIKMNDPSAFKKDKTEINNSQQVVVADSHDNLLVASSGTISIPPINISKNVSNSFVKKKFIINFSTRINMSSDGNETLRKVFFLLKNNNNLHVKVTGYSDSATGSEAANLRVSVARAKFVKENLEKLGISSDRIEASGVGGTDPVAPNDTELGRKINRRVEISIF